MPQGWNEIHIGMTRQQVLEKIGSANQDGLDIEVSWWTKNELTGNEELCIYFTDDRVSDFYIKRYFGTSEHFTWLLTRSETDSQLPH